MSVASTPSRRNAERAQNQRSAILMGVVRHAEKTSAGSSALCGSVSSAPHAASKITSDMPAPRGIAPPIVASAAPRDTRGTVASV